MSLSMVSGNDCADFVQMDIQNTQKTKDIHHVSNGKYFVYLLYFGGDGGASQAPKNSSAPLRTRLLDCGV